MPKIHLIWKIIFPFYTICSYLVKIKRKFSHWAFPCLYFQKISSLVSNVNFVLNNLLSRGACTNNLQRILLYVGRIISLQFFKQQRTQNQFNFYIYISLSFELQKQKIQFVTLQFQGKVYKISCTNTCIFPIDTNIQDLSMIYQKV